MAANRRRTYQNNGLRGKNQAGDGAASPLRGGGEGRIAGIGRFSRLLRIAECRSTRCQGSVLPEYHSILS